MKPTAARFLGRGRSPADPAALDPGVALSGTTGPVLDPILSLRRRVRLEPGESTTVAFTTGVADTRRKPSRWPTTTATRPRRPVRSSWPGAHSQVEHRHRNWSPDEAHLFQRLAAHVLYAGSALRAPAPLLAANRQGQPALWRYGISGDLPIILVRIAEGSEMPLVRQVLTAPSPCGSKDSWPTWSCSMSSPAATSRN